MQDKYVFNSPEPIAAYLTAKLSNPTPLKLQKTLYFLYAFYSATYGNIDYSEGEFDKDKPYPTRLFPATFKAAPYGPILINIDQNALYNAKPNINAIKHDTAMLQNIWLFINSIANQVDSVNDFGLVTRSHQDKCWQKAYQSNNKIISDALIKHDYITYVDKT